MFWALQVCIGQNSTYILRYLLEGYIYLIKGNSSGHNNITQPD